MHMQCYNKILRTKRTDANIRRIDNLRNAFLRQPGINGPNNSTRFQVDKENIRTIAKVARNFDQISPFANNHLPGN
ncbi:hypothetical protein CEXT_145431 [Caerostris extrusa]|uniref:Uncharacterized protein n=1 Tax=Caerostris extrusa TaxID=172846 RepID=A0AAV4Q2I4_CAEEX|nr:hypothetical protein CEXT_145431 [Caerostris extrusa]